MGENQNKMVLGAHSKSRANIGIRARSSATTKLVYKATLAAFLVAPQ